MKSIKLCIAAGLVAVLSSASFAGEWAGKYETQDTKGNAMSITLSGDGIAVGLKHGKTLDGTWRHEDGAAVISWTTGWTTKLSKNGDRYIKSAYRPGTPMENGPTHTGEAEKIE